MPAQLQGADIGDDRPAIARRNLPSEGRHRAVALGDHLEEMADRCAAEALDMIGRRRRVATLDDDAAARAERIVAYYAIDHEAILPVLQNFLGDRERKAGDGIGAVLGRLDDAGQR